MNACVWRERREGEETVEKRDEEKKRERRRVVVSGVRCGMLT